MIAKFIIATTFIVIVFCLGSALFHMIKHKDSPEKMLKALSFRIGLSVLLFIFLFIAMLAGWLKPHGIGPAYQQQTIQQEK